jgi:hypothetical protein
MLRQLLEELRDATAVSIRATLDDCAAAWIAARASSGRLTRQYAQPLLEDLAKQLGAKLELVDPPG